MSLQQFDSHSLEKKFEKRFKKILHNPEKVIKILYNEEFDPGSG